jgi:hypothetical protein
MSRFVGEYTADWRKVRDDVYEAVGHRCIRCGHPYCKKNSSGTPILGGGRWSPCDHGCHHSAINITMLDGLVYAEWRILTTHHFDGNKANNQWWNLMALCQRCHLKIQGNVNPEVPYFLPHSEWIRPYVAGFYAHKYLNEKLTREQTLARLEELLKLECKTS